MIIRKDDLTSLIKHIRETADDLERIVNAPMEKSAEVKKEDNIQLSDIRAVLAAKSREGYGDKVRALIKSYGADKLSAIDPSHYSEMLKEAEVFGSAS
ncbi:hypothetical protein [Eubacterium sp. F2]|uniref:hypothetical protein n=1 Tax=Eubacterium sp. F2 TaxID=3381348 RepID=UPI003907EB43